MWFIDSLCIQHDSLLQVVVVYSMCLKLSLIHEFCPYRKLHILGLHHQSRRQHWIFVHPPAPVLHWHAPTVGVQLGREVAYMCKTETNLGNHFYST